MSFDSRWDSRFDSKSTQLSIKLLDNQNSLPSENERNQASLAIDQGYYHTNAYYDIGQLLRAASKLPRLRPQSLMFDKTIGTGANFRVSRELLTSTKFTPYFVAVKHMLIKERSPTHLRRMYKTALRELQVITSPPLKGHPCIIRALAYGWTDDPLCGLAPFIVVDYSDYGTLNEFLQKCKPTLHERRDLVLDVAAGIEALHNNRFIHGDIKPQNILVFGTQDDTIDRLPQIAKLADFGCTVSEEEIMDPGFHLLGTTRYNAPEIEMRTRPSPSNTLELFGMFANSDVFSFGLLIWEVMKNGKSYMEASWLSVRETEAEFRQRLCDTEKDGLLQRAAEYCKTQKIMSSLEDRPTLSAFKKAMNVCLKDDLLQRANIGGVIKCLTQAEVVRSQAPSHQTQMSGIPESDLGLLERCNRHDLFQSKDLIKSGPSAGIQGFKTALARGVVKRTTFESEVKRPIPPEFLKGVANEANIVTHRRGKLRLPSTKSCLQQSLDFLKSPMAEFDRPPWEVQTLLIKELQGRIQFAQNLSERGEALLQLSVCHHLGFGIAANEKATLLCLSKASPHNFVAAAIEDQVKQAIDEKYSPSVSHLAAHWQIPVYEQPGANPSGPLARRVRIFQRRACDQVVDLMRNDQDPYAVSLLHSVPSSVLDQVRWDPIFRYSMLETAESFKNFLVTESYLPIEALSEPLTTACRYGRFDAVVTLATRCTFFVGKLGLPNPLHWLISFDPDEAVFLARMLIEGPSDSTSTKGICASLIDDLTDESVFLPEHSMELFGTPLHWAVRTRHLPLVQEYIRLGADIDSTGASVSGAGEMPRQLEFRPLDLAVIFHLPEIVDFLLTQHLVRNVTQLAKEHTLFHLIGQETQPFARFVIHGKHHKKAVEDTLQILLNQDLNINIQDLDGEVPLSQALYQVASEKYILEALLKKGASVEGIRASDGQSIATRVILDCANRPYDSWKLSLVLPLVENLNRRDDFGRNPLHYSAIAGSVSMAEILLESQRVDIDATDSKGRTAMALSAMLGKAAMLELLLRRGGAKELPDRLGRTPLQWAISSRNHETINAAIRFHSQSISSTVLHEAIMGTTEGSRISIVKYILDQNASLGISSPLNTKNSALLTPLQLAARRGDVSAVKALVAAGADCTITNNNGWDLSNLVRGNSIGRKLVAGLYIGTALEIVTKVLALVDDRGNPFTIADPRIQFLEIGGSIALKEFRNALEEIKIFLTHC